MMTATHKTSADDRVHATMKSLVQWSAILLFVGLIGCQHSQPPQTATSEEQPDAEQVDDTAKQKAIAAKDALFTRLSGRLTEVMSADGPAAISVCSREAPAIATEVGEEQGVVIGRTSFKLRNAKNTPPDWAHSFVEERVEDPQFVALPNGGTGALLPIRLKQKCLACHGPTESIAADVRSKLSELYPDDRATGFNEGDLRGWFWVEVPSAVGDNDAESGDDKEAAAISDSDSSEAGHGPGPGHGQGRGFGRGMGRGPGMMGGNREDMTTLHAMFDDRDKINRTVKMMPKGAEAVTESDDEKIAALIQKHVPAMESRVHENEPLPPMTFHPIFVELIKHGDDYTLTYEETDKGLKVTYEADDPFVIMLVQEHAKLVSRFIKNGMEEIHKPYNLPKVEQEQSEAKGVSKEATEPASLGITPPLPSRAKAPTDNPTTPAKVELGKKLFFDPRLSLTGTVSCNSCHNIMEGGDDGRPSSMGVHGRLGRRNAPTVWNSVFQASQFWDGRSPSLEDQAKGPVIASPEMGMPNHDKAIERIAAIPGYQAEFSRVFGDDKPVTIDNAVKAIAAFERTLVTPNSPYDRYVKGDKYALSDQQIRGMKLFDSIGCTECHSGPAFNGWEVGDTEPSFEEFPRFATSEFLKQFRLDSDHGRYEATKREADKHYFKVPTLRNITITAPYFHNGAVESLSDAVRVMAETELDSELSEKDVADIVEFLTSLDGEFPEITLPRLPSRSGESVLEDQQPAAMQH
ncbi:cytochrome c peroxidase [Rubinisphaera italica]|uniref:Cytochrome c551 peroxidase n=1 Tax=Rubinisphaera italica TaxID=2527969 RepID=A0A5C5XG95_9PLAN|nr:cytochrome c peroxidase [Rubinisphaera italica]TWT61689.1 Cytochrome c551 peroxidase precursor [Rubinisphaera italica]